jgi:hypothetical protein
MNSVRQELRRTERLGQPNYDRLPAKQTRTVPSALPLSGVVRLSQPAMAAEGPACDRGLDEVRDCSVTDVRPNRTKKSLAPITEVAEQSSGGLQSAQRAVERDLLARLKPGTTLGCRWGLGAKEWGGVAP